VTPDDRDLAPGLREELVTRKLAGELAALAGRVEEHKLERSEAVQHLRRYAASLAISAVDAAGGGAQSADQQAEFLNRFVEWALPDRGDEALLDRPPRLLTGIAPAPDGVTVSRLPERPQVPLTANELLVNDRKQPSIGSQLAVELQSAESVDLICAFVIWSGVVTLLDTLEDLVRGRGGRLRVITTTYMGATERKALDALANAGADVRVAYDAQRTKLHAKAWLLTRPRGLSTGFIGSSNLSRTAMHDGLEWNVRLAEAEASSILDRMRGTFDTYWADDAFEPYDPRADAARFDAALGRQRQRKGDASPFTSFASLDVVALPHQRLILEDLVVQRERHDRHRNLVVAATGTGKTVVAALDYRALCERAGRPLTLLFVAHRETIIQQSRATFAHVMKNPSFGEILGAGQRPESGRHVFAMVQSLHAETVRAIEPDAFDVVIVDEFHHAEAPSYSALLEHLEPGELLGLTATPERMDGGDVTRWFGGRIAHELRVWDAIDRGYLSPFQYFGVSDTEDLSQLVWKRGGYDARELERVFTANDARVMRVLQALERYHAAPERMRALGFCVSVAHAEFMDAEFNRRGVASRVITGRTPDAERHHILDELRTGSVRCVFSVDVLGEGVDVPNVDTVLLLRPTQSATVFAQQLGRGLRLSDGKAYLTVVDLIGQQHRNFRFEDRLRAVVDERQGTIREQAEEGFPYLPSGCSMVLDRQARSVVLENLRRAATSTQWATLVDELREIGDVELLSWAQRSGRRVADLYRATDRSWTRLRRDAGLPTAPSVDGEVPILRAIRRLDHIDDPERTLFYLDVLSAQSPPDTGSLGPREERMLSMLCVGLGLGQKGQSLPDALRALWPHRAVREELEQLFAALDDQSTRLEEPLDALPAAPLALHASYSRPEALLALGDGTAGSPPTTREGVRWVKGSNADAFFVTLRKSERSFSPTTMYRDYAISRDLFHWESQNATHEDTPVGQRYIGHAARGTHVLLFVRELEHRPNGAGAPFTFLGPVDYVSHVGGRPMQITWRLQHPLPEAILETSQLLSAA
jgi:superfamily II DNA or RNA helicase/HKD family nuclease